MNEIPKNAIPHLLDIVSKLKQGKVALFLGSGCSVVSGAPLKESLINSTKQRFPKIQTEDHDLLKLCQKVVNTEPYTYSDLLDFVEQTLETLQPSEYHKKLTKYNWSGIFTTNYDDLIEKAYNDPQRTRRAIVFYGDEETFHFSERDKIHVFKLMGTIGKRESLTQPVLTHRQYLSAFKEKYRIYDLLLDIVKDGTVVFIGYSFEDELAIEVYNTAISHVQRDAFPHSYFIAPHADNINSELSQTLSDLKITPLNLKFEDFVDYLEANYDSIVEDTSRVNSVNLSTLMLKGLREPLPVSGGLIKEVEQFGHLLTSEKLKSDPGDKDLFFKGKNASWGAFRSNWDFKRDIYSEIKKRIDTNLSRTNPDDNLFLLVMGPPGCGKSILLKRLAYDLAIDGRLVFFLEPKLGEVDLKSLDALLREINKSYDRFFESKGEDIDRLKFVIVVDDAGTSQINPNVIKNHMTSRGTPCLVVGASRESEWQSSLIDNPISLSERNIFRIEDQPNASELNRLHEHIVKLGYSNLPPISISSENAEDKSFFGTLYTYIHPSRLPLSKIIQDQLQLLSDIERKAFINICLFSQFNISLNQELLVRSLSVGYVEFYNKIYTKRIGEITIENTDYFENKLYDALHRIVASLAIRFYLKNEDELYHAYAALLSKAKMDIDNERRLIERLLVEFLGAKKKFTNLNLLQKEALFEVICSKRNSKTLLHHYGIIKHGLKKYEEAENLLEKALNLGTSFSSNLVRGESNRNIMVSLGTLYSDWAMASFDAGKNDIAERFLKLAELNFENARFAGPPNAYPYHAQANMYFVLSQKQENKEEKMKIYGKALSVTSLAEANLDKEDLAPIYELKSRIYRNLGDTENDLKLARKLMTEYGDPSGLIGFVVYQSDEYRKEREPKLQQKIAYNILEALSESMNLMPRDEGILRLNARMTIMLFPLDSEKKMNELKKWYDIATKYDLELMFQLSVLLFEAYNLEESKKIFDNLAKMSQGLAKRFVARKYFMDRKGEKQVFEGIISNITDEYNGEITINSIKTSIYFRPIAVPFTPNEGDMVKFHISFSYRGPRADVIERI